MGNTLIIYGPMACGKTRNKKALAAHYGFENIVDDWHRKNRRDKSPVPDNSLVLTYEDVSKDEHLGDCRIISFDDAMKEAGLA